MSIYKDGGLLKVAFFTTLLSISLIWTEGSCLAEEPSLDSPSTQFRTSSNEIVSPIVLRAYEIEEVSEQSNQDGTPGPGEVFSLNLILENLGTDPVDLTHMDVRHTPYLRLIQGANVFGEVNPGGRVEGTFQVEIQPNSPVDTLLSLSLLMADDTLTLNLHILPQWNNITLSSKIVNPGESVQFNTHFEDGRGFASSKGIGEVKVVIKDQKQNIIDTLPLFDDGLHGDGGPSDGNFGNLWWTPQGQRDYVCDLEIFDDRYFHRGRIEKIIGFSTIQFRPVGNILLVMDAPDPSFEILYYYRNSLKKIQTSDEVRSFASNLFRNFSSDWTEWNTWIRGKIDTLSLNEFIPDGVVIWSSPWGGTLRYDDEVQASIQWFLNRGGKLLICGEGVGNHIHDYGKEKDSLFYANTLKSKYIQSFEPEGYFERVVGVTGDPLSENLEITIVDERGVPQYFAEEIDPVSPAVPFLTFSPWGRKGIRMRQVQSTGTAGLRYEKDDSRLIYLSFGLEGIGKEENRRILLERMVSWLTIGETFIHDDSIPEEVEIVSVQNFPNPFTPETFITYDLHLDGVVHLRVADITGRTIKVLFDGEERSGTHSTRWNGIDEVGKEVSSGVYFLNLTLHYIHPDTEQILRSTATRKILLLR
jgi:hypothetical protein